jgi:N-acetylglutamate synthase-like GNAT family acetyltransferase
VKSTSAALVTREIDPTDRAELDRFIELPFRLYRGCPCWTPPLRVEMRDRMNPRKNKFFEHSSAAFIVAEKTGNVVGRIAVLKHRFYNEVHQNDTAFFYWFEAENEQAIADALFAAAETWARSRGLRRLLGPIGFIQPDPPGILVQGFEHEGTVDVPWHFPYLESLVTGAGFAQHRDYLSGYLGRDVPLPPALAKTGTERLRELGYRSELLGGRRAIKSWADQFYHTYLTAFEAVPDFYAMSRRDFQDLMDRLSLVIDVKRTQGISDGDNLVGFILCFRDITPGLRRARGRLFPFGWWHLLLSRLRSRQCNIIALGVLPAYQKSGANLAMLAEFLRTVRQGNDERTEIVQIVEGNLNTHGDMTRLGAKWDKVHRVYRRDFAGLTTLSP